MTRRWMMAFQLLATLAVLVEAATGNAPAESSAKPPSPPTRARIALLDVSRPQPAAGAFLELLEAELAGSNDVEVLARDDMDALLREQLQGLLATEPDAAALAVQAGNLLSATAFLFVEELPGEPPLLKLTWTDTRYGIKLNRLELITPETPLEQEQVVALAKTETLRLLAHWPVDLSAVPLLCVSLVLSVEPGLEGTQAARSMVRGIEMALMRAPGILVAERSHARPLREERGWDVDLPPALRASAAQIRIEYEMDGTRADHLVLHYSVVRGEEELARGRASGIASNPFAIGLEIANGIVRRLAPHTLRPSNPAQEARRSSPCRALPETTRPRWDWPRRRARLLQARLTPFWPTSPA